MDSIFVHSFARFGKGTPFKDENRDKAFSVMLSRGIQKGYETYLSDYKSYNKRKKELKKAWIFEDGKWKKVKNKKVSLFYYHGKTRDIYDECKKIKKIINLPTLNHLELEQVCDDKLLTFNIFPDLSPRTFVVNDFYELQRVVNYIRSDKIVLKPRFGSYGRGVVVLDKRRLTNGIKKDTIVQEFVDSSKGVLNIKKVHDFRIIVIDGKINHAYLRIPKNGSLICNASLGADKIFIENEEIPYSILKRVKNIDKHLRHYGPRVYSADFAVDENRKPWLIELNSKPGMIFYDKAPELRTKYFDSLYKSFNKLL